MRIYLIRHGESQGNVDASVYGKVADHAIGLSDKGKEQARGAGEALRRHLDEHERGEAKKEELLPLGYHLRLWHSPYRRTRETAAELEGVLGNRITSTRENVLLCEQQFGLFDGVPDEELPKRFPDEYAYYEKLSSFHGRFWARMPMGESRFDVARRVHEAFGAFHRDFAEQGIEDIIVVCHGVTLRAFVMMWCHKSPEWFEDEPNPHNCAIRVINGAEDGGYLFEGF